MTISESVDAEPISIVALGEKIMGDSWHRTLDLLERGMITNGFDSLSQSAIYPYKA